MVDEPALAAEALDFVYMPSRDAAADMEYFVSVLGARLVFAIEAFDTRVAMVRLGEPSPALLFAEHLSGQQPILVYRVADLEDAIDSLRQRGLQPGPRFEIPHGPGCLIQTPGAQRLATYQLTRPEAAARLEGRRDF